MSDDVAPRAQSEVLGVVLLTVVVAVVALTIGAVVVTQTGQDDSGPTTDLLLDVSATDATLSHNGGDPLALADLAVVLEHGGSETRFTPAPANATGGDATLEPGESIKRGHGATGGDVSVLVIHEPSNTILLDDSERVPT